MVQPHVQAAINSAFDLERQRHGLPSDNELARHIGISPKTLSFARNGHVSPVASALLNLVVSNLPAAAPSADAAPAADASHPEAAGAPAATPHAAPQDQPSTQEETV